MARRPALLSSVCVAACAVLACQQTITAPGACPEFCPTTQIEMVDSLLIGVIDQDTSHQGYVPAHTAILMQVATGGGQESRVLLRFRRFGDAIPITTTATAPVVERDSFRLDLIVTRRSADVSGLGITVYRIPTSIDSLTTFDAVAPFFDDSLIVGVVLVPEPDSTGSDTISTVLLAAAFPTFVEDAREITIGLAIRSTTPLFATLGTEDGVRGAGITRFVKADSADGQLTPASDFRAVAFDTFVHTDPAPPQPATLTVGGTPSTRSFLRLNIPSFVIDSSQVLGAKLLLVPVEPVLGAPGDTFNLIANALSADFGPKSPLLIALDSSAIGIPVAVGTSDTIALDITSILRRWQNNPDQVRTLVLRLRTEAATFAELRVGSSQRVGAAPSLRVTYVPPFSLVQR